MLAIGTMAAGIGLTTAMLAVLNGTVWHPLPFKSADRMVAIEGPVTSETVADWAASARSFDALAGYRTKRYTLTGVGDAVSLKATVATGQLFPLLDARAASGRALDRADDRGDSLAVVVSDRCWRTTFRADPSLPGRTVYLNGTPFLVVGIMPPGFQFPVNAEPIDLYTTVAADLRTDRRPAEGTRPRDLMVVARLKPGVDAAQARAEMDSLIAAADVATGARRPARRPAQVVPLASDIAASVLSPITMLSAAVAGVMAIACATATVLSLIRVTSRRDEWATRTAVGATRADIARQLLAESALIALSGGAVGALIAAAVARPLLLVAGPAVNAAARVRFDVRVFAWAGLSGVMAAAVFGAVPAVQAAVTRWSEPQAARRVSGTTASAVRGVLVATEIALVVVLIAGSISLLRAYTALSHTDTGFKPAGVLTFRVDLSDAAYSSRQQTELFEQLRSSAAGVPGVDAAAFTALPPFGDLRFTIRLDAPGGAPQERRRGGADVHLVSPGYFRAMGIPLVDGREFTGEDRPGHDPVIVLSRAAAARQFPGLDPIGRRLDLRVGPNARGPLPRVVGVVGDIRNGTLTAPGEPQVYLPYSQAPMLPSTTFVVRVREGDRGAVVSAIRQQLRRLDPTVPLVNVRPLDDFLWSATSLPRFTALLVGVFAATAVFLGMAGLYAVVSYASLSRRREFSIRRALGATESRVARLVIRQCLQMLIPGLAVGAVGSVAFGRVLESVLYGVRPSPASTIAAALVLTATLALLAAWWPARSAGRDDLRVRLQSNA